MSISLFNFIHTLNASEKRHFKLNALQKQGIHKNYLILFGILESYKNYDEEQILATYGEQCNLETFIPTKYYLRRKLMESLRQYYSKDISLNSPKKNQIRVLLDNAYLYSLKGFDAQVKKAVLKAENLAEKGEFLEEFLDIQEKKIDLFPRIFLPKNQDEKTAMIQKWSEDKHDIIEEIYIRNHLNNIKNHIEYLVDFFVIADKQVSLYENKIMLTKIPKTKYNQILYFYIKSLFARYHKKYEEWAKLNCKIISIWEAKSSSKILKYYTSEYLLHYNNTIFSLLTIQKYDKTLKYLEEFQNLDTRHKKKIQLTIEQKEDWQTLLLSSQFRVYFVTKQYDKLLQIEQTVLDFFKTSNPKLWNANSGMFIYYFAHVHFLKKNYQHCIDLLVDLLKTELTKEVATFIDKGSILYLICHYELGNFKFLEYEINKVLRRAGGNKTLDSKPALLAKTLKKVLLPNFDFSSLAKDKNVQKLKKIETETFDANRDISIIEWLNKLY